MRAENAAWGWVLAMAARHFTLESHSLTLEFICDVTNSQEPMAASRWGLPSDVTFTPVPAKVEVASAWYSFLVTNQVLEAFGKYP